MKKMKKVLFLMFLLFLIVLGTANIKAQVRIGGNGVPNAAAVLDLNADDTNAGTKGLALPRVSLTNVSTPLTGTPTVNGMLVYNTGGALTAGIYFWSGSIWNRVDDAIGNELTDTIAGGGLTKSGSGTAADPYKVGIKAGGITTGMIANGAVTGNKIATVLSDSGLFLVSTGTGWVAGGFNTTGFRNPDSVATNQNVTCTWTLVLDSIFVVQITPGHFTSIVSPGSRVFDICSDISNNNSAIYKAGNGAIYHFPVATAAGPISRTIRLVCWRPSAY